MWQRNADVLWRRVLDDVVILAPRLSDPFALGGGAEMWDLLGEPISAPDLAASLSSGSEAEPRLELLDLLAQLWDCGAVDLAPS